ncbi:septum formation family protein [Paeniglutamicibacter sp. NPDC012692]|uniref:septum formation family protein n=1 Tax=Paeniglutamicibacter sp. NPDC012692 TaxID=3364388 RepID=UPI0036C3E162
MKIKSPRWRALTAGLACLAALSMTGCDQTQKVYAESTKSMIGTCHALLNSEEFDATSDSRPPVDCTEPHTSETYAVYNLTGELTKGLWATRRPNQQQLKALTGEICPYNKIRRYLGAAVRDASSNLSIVAYYPSPESWETGDRSVRCDLTSYTKAGEAPVSTYSLRNSLKSLGASDNVRECYTFDRAFAEGTTTSCDKHHQGIAVNAWLTLENKSWKQETLSNLCKPYAHEFAKAHKIKNRKPTGLLETNSENDALTLKCALESKQ